jgi:hypothetical protein
MYSQSRMILAGQDVIWKDEWWWASPWQDIYVIPILILVGGCCKQVLENMNRRTAEQGTAEYRSEKHCLIAFKNFCCSKFLVRYSIFKIQNRPNPTPSGTATSAVFDLRQSQQSLTTPIEDPAVRGRTWFSKDRIILKIWFHFRGYMRWEILSLR